MAENQVLAPEEIQQRADEKSALKHILIKLAIFAAALALNQLVVSYAFLYGAVLLGAKSLSGDSLYFVSLIINALAAYVFPTLALVAIFRSERENMPVLKKYDGFRSFEIPIFFTAMIFVGSLASIIANIIADWLNFLFGTGEITDALQSIAPEGEMSYWFFMFFVCIVAPVCEELIFRRLLLLPLRRCGDGFAVIVSALIFGIYHGNFDQLPNAVAVGVFLALIDVRANSIVPSLILHVANNTFVSFYNYTTKIFGSSSFTQTLDNVLSGAYTILFWGGIAALFYMVLTGYFSFEKRGALSPHEKTRVIFRSPALYIGIVLMAVLMF